MDLSASFQNTKEDMSLARNSFACSPERKKSWRAPLVMLSSFLLAVILAILHDCMNRSLNGSIVSLNGPWSQKWTSRYGTALAFLVKMFFVTSIGTAFVQRLWLNLSTHQQVIPVQALDVLSSALSTPFSLFSSLVWLQNPLLLMIALISWTLPFAVIVTPGTLSVESVPHINVKDRLIVRQFQGGFFYNSAGPGYINNEDACLLDNSGTQKGEVMDNCITYTLGSQELSRLAFATATASRILPSKSDVAHQKFSGTFLGSYLRCADANSTTHKEASNIMDYNNIAFLSWVGETPWPHTRNGSFTNSSLQGRPFQTSAPSVFARPSNRREVNDTLWIARTEGNGFVVKECQLWNTSYKVKFAYKHFEETVTIHNLTYINPISTISGPDVEEVSRRNELNMTWKAMLSSFASIFVGVLSRDMIDVTGNDLASPIMLSASTGIQQSNFGLLSIPSGSLGKTVEEMFHNFTLSLFSLPTYTVNGTDNLTATATITTWSTTFVYQQRDLLLAYGISTLVSLICCGFGLDSFYRNGGSFQNNFSTYIRAAEGSDWDIRSLALFGDTGADPLPRRIGEKKIRMVSNVIR